MHSLLQWLESLPGWALYGSMAVMAAIENVFPPIPADTIVLIGSLLAARGQGSASVAFLAVWTGNIIGAMVMYWAGRRFGAAWLESWLHRSRMREKQEHKLEELYRRFGLPALAFARLLPGVRALVPPFAGALRLPVPSVLLVMAIPSGLWYATVTYVGFQMGANLDAALQRLESLQGWLLLAGLVVVCVGTLFWFLLRRRRKVHEGPTILP